ncbi:hypothetical protein ACFX2G_005190 [Malus domestica]
MASLMAIVPLSGKQETAEQAPKPINGSELIWAVEEEKQLQGQHQESIEDQPSQVDENHNRVEENPNQVEKSEEVVQGSYEHEKEVYNQVPTMDICESLFGYWPCLARDFKRGNGNDCLFGSSNSYGEIRDDGSNYLQ